MFPSLFRAPPVIVFILCLFHAGSLGDMAWHIALEGFDYPLQLAGCFFQRCHVQYIGRHVAGLFLHMGCEVHVGASDVCNFRLALLCRLGKVGKAPLHPDQVLGSVSTILQCLIPLSEVRLGFNEVGLEGCPGFWILSTPRPTILKVLYCLREKSVKNEDDIGICDRLDRWCC